MAASTKKIEANRQNAQKSSGSKTKPGKNRSRYNAKKHGLLTETFEPVEGTFEKEKGLEKLTDELYDEYLPKSPLEKIMVERLISVTWRLRRIQLIDANEFKIQFESQEQPAMIDHENLNLICRYETMLNRQFYQIIDRLEKLQGNRKTGEEEEVNQRNVKIRNEPIEGKNGDNPLQSNQLEKTRSSNKPQTPRPTAIRKPAINTEPSIAMKCSPNLAGIYAANAIKGGLIRQKLI